MSHIAVDIDSTLYDFETPAREACFRLFAETGDESYKIAAYHPWTEWRSPADVLGVEKWLKAIAVCHDGDIIRAQIPFDGAVETCQALMDAGHHLLYISNRAVESAEATEDWLFEQGFMGHTGMSRVTCLMGDKKPHMAECQYLIDDRLKTCVEFVYDFDWQEQIRARARWHRDASEDPRLIEEVDRLLQIFDDTGEFLSKENFVRLRELEQEVEGEFIQQNSRKAFVKAYPYNQAGTDIPGLYLAPTWTGINRFLVKEGLLQEPAYRALESV